MPAQQRTHPGPRSLLLLLAALLSLGSSLSQAEEPVDFSRDVRPLLSDRCFQCHGPDRHQRQAGLRFDRSESAFGELESGGRAIVPGDLQASAIIDRITAEDAFMRMPPADSGKTLSPDEIDIIKRWVAEGAKWGEHWAFVPPVRPQPPEVKHAAHVRNPIDRFILARLEREGLSPSPPASKETLIRRVTLDLTGLPPTIKEIDDFLADTSEQAYEKVVDRLLQSPRHGEHRARYWLDAARYGDTHGLHLDNERSLWPYRNWVIDALNNNMPFDRFTIEQLGGDLLPERSLAQLVATGFNRCNVTTSEGGSIAEEYRVRYAVDRVETTSTVWMGLTLGCAVCHDHKFDPFSQREFYQLFAYFNSLTENPMDGNALLPPPVAKVPSAEQQQQRKALNAQLAAIEKQIEQTLTQAAVQAAEQAAAGTAPAPQEVVWIEDALPAGAGAEDLAGTWEFTSAPAHPVHSGKQALRAKADKLAERLITGAKQGLRIGRGDKLFAYVYIDPLEQPEELMLQLKSGQWEHFAYWGEDRISRGVEGSRKKIGPLPEVGRWVRLEVPAEKVGLEPGDTVTGWGFAQHGGLVYWDRAGILTTAPQGEYNEQLLADWEQMQEKLSGVELPAGVQAALKVAEEKRAAKQKLLVLDYFLRYVEPAANEQFGQLSDTKKQLAALEKSIPGTMVMQEMAKPRPAHVLIRGEYDKPGEKVARNVPSVLPPLPEDAPNNRLGLAQWLVDPVHPLTARVTVNRYWQQYFGTGLVKTSEDFGSQGEWPSHPDLLDWLAREFIESGWDMKHMHKLIVTSGTYRQTARVLPEHLEKDRANRLLARGPRFRMDAEMVRDSALFVSGLLHEEIGGHSVKPYQPPGLWKIVGYTSSNTANFKRDDGQALYRRSMYTFWKRTSPPPSMLVFDAPSRETCTVRRERTNTPLQALTLMNDVQYVEASRKLAERMLHQGGKTPADIATYAFRLATSRRPDASETAVLLDNYQAQLAYYRQHPEEAAKLVGQGEAPRDASLDPAEHAAWTMVANLLLNLDETVTKG